jgi:Family of unknown function (DUF6065)
MPYINEPGFEVPDNKIIAVPFHGYKDEHWKDIIQPLKGDPKRDWFTPHHYYCLPLTIGNQYGFVIKSLYDFDAIWDGTEKDAVLTFHTQENNVPQGIKVGFGNGTITIQNHFTLRTPVGINLMTIQPPNMFIAGCAAITGVVETDNLRRDFTFNLKITVPHYRVSIKKGDPLGAFLPIPRYFVDKFDMASAHEHFSEEVFMQEKNDVAELGKQRSGSDKEKAHESGRKYFNGEHAYGEPYPDHQKRVR